MTLLLASCSDTEQESDAYGNFEAVVTTVSAETAGRLHFLHAQEGARLKAGKSVALIDTLQLDLQRKQLEATIGTLPQKLRSALEELEVLKKQKANLVRERDRVARLIERNAATDKQLDDLNGQMEVLDKQMEAVRAGTATQNQAILAEKEPLQAQIALVNQQIRRSTIQNPVTGTVLTRLAEAGEFVGPGVPLYRIARLDTLDLLFYVDAVQLQTLRLGSRVEVLTDQGTDAYARTTGTISWISEEAEFTPKTIQTKKDRVNLVYAVKARVANPEGLLKIGMPAEVNIEPSGEKTAGQ
ncbi:MAG: HlyD family efflux transporter periplasmic adaptor subunit [Bacteroidetes bacterium]|nr:HlyD family efflux transporter periplasmic adaptor subunit [Bacteroidota bacterium]